MTQELTVKFLIKTYQTQNYPIATCFVVFAQSIEARYEVENEDVAGAAPTGDAPTTSEWSTILLPTRVRLVLEVYGTWRGVYIYMWIY